MPQMMPMNWLLYMLLMILLINMFIMMLFPNMFNIDFSYYKPYLLKKKILYKW